MFDNKYIIAFQFFKPVDIKEDLFILIRWEAFPPAGEEYNKFLTLRERTRERAGDTCRSTGWFTRVNQNHCQEGGDDHEQERKKGFDTA